MYKDSVYAIGRKLKMPGVEVQAHLNPANITPRVFNSAKRMLERGVIIGWGGAAQVARHIVRSGKCPYLALNTWGLESSLNFKLPPDAFAQATELFEAYQLCERLQHPSLDEQFIQRRRKDADHFLSGNRTYLNVSDKNIAFQLAEIIHAAEPEEVKQLRKDLAARFTRCEVFQIEIYN